MKTQAMKKPVVLVKLRETLAARQIEMGITSPERDHIIHSTPYMNGRATTRGVLKRMRFFLGYGTVRYRLLDPFAEVTLTLSTHPCNVFNMDLNDSRSATALILLGKFLTLIPGPNQCVTVCQIKHNFVGGQVSPMVGVKVIFLT